MLARMDQVRALLARHEADAVLLSFLPDVRWACGFTGSNGLLLVRQEGAHFLSDGRYRAQAEGEVQGADVHIPGYDLLGHIAEAGLLAGAGRVVFQSDYVTAAQLGRLEEQFPDVGWHGAEKLLAEPVARKTDEEVERIRQAQRLTEAVFEHVLAFIRPGMTEKDVAAEIVYQHLRRGAEAMSFEPIVASGPQGALPHARPTSKRIEKGDLVVLDFGCFLDGYASDMTRTIAVGEPGEAARKVYGVVLEAQKCALDAAQAGLPSNALDAAARDVIEEAGHGEAFPHSLGHGIGLQTHEWPSVSFRHDVLLPENAAVTIEPGIYLPGRFGVRIEDIVVLREGGCENLTTAPKELEVLLALGS